jgi:S-adenosylmethionine:tRNA-ribosyltransferase-isomerase (queuine synthetase)
MHVQHDEIASAAQQTGAALVEQHWHSKRVVHVGTCSQCIAVSMCQHALHAWNASVVVIASTAPVCGQMAGMITDIPLVSDKVTATKLPPRNHVWDL